MSRRAQRDEGAAMLRDWAVMKQLAQFLGIEVDNLFELIALGGERQGGNGWVVSAEVSENERVRWLTVKMSGGTEYVFAGKEGR